MLRAGVKIYERRDVILHSKTALIDGVWATVGSTNLDWRSFLHNHELNAVVLGAEFGHQVQAMFDKDLAASDAITLERWQSRPDHPAPEGAAGQPVGVLALNTRGRRFDQGGKLMTLAPVARSGSPMCAMACSERQHVAGAQLGCSKPAARPVRQLAGTAVNNHQLTGNFDPDDRFQAVSRQIGPQPATVAGQLVSTTCTAALH